MTSRRVALALLLLALAAVALASLALGPTSIGLSAVVEAVFHPSRADPTARAIIWDARLPRLCLALSVGAALAVAGAIMQGFFQNPMAAPSIIGVSSGAALGATIAIVSGLAATAPFIFLPASAFIGALTAVSAVYLLSRRGGRTPVELLLLTGIAVGSLASAIASFIMIRGQRGDLDLVVFWMLGSLANRGWSEVAFVAAYTAGGCLAAILLARYLDVLSLGDEQALYLGVEVEKIRAALLAAAAFLAAAAVSVTGVIGFVGLIVPHIARIVFGPQHRTLIPTSALGGMLTLAAADLVANLAGEVPVGVITAMLGCPFFLWLLRRRPTVNL